MHRRISCKRMKQMMTDIGAHDEHTEDQLLLEEKEQAVSEDKQIIEVDSEAK